MVFPTRLQKELPHTQFSSVVQKNVGFETSQVDTSEEMR